MFSLKLYGKNDLRMVEVPKPEIGPGELLLRTQAAAVCGTDVRMWRFGAKGVDETHPLTLGHEFAGEIVEVDEGVPYYQVGMRVSMQPNIGCGICDRCVRGDFHLCADYKAFGINMDGAFAEYVRIPASAVQRGNLQVLPDHVTAAQAAVVEPLSCVYNGQQHCNVKPGDQALVVGAGPIGYCHAMMLHMAGANVWISDLSAGRLALIQERLPYVKCYCGDDLPGFIARETNGQGLDVAIAACPSPQIQTLLPSLMNYGGRICLFGGIPAEKQPVMMDTNLIHYKELYITGSARSSIAQYRKSMQFVSQGQLEVQGMITDRYPFRRAIEAFENAANAKGIKHVIEFDLP